MNLATLRKFTPQLYQIAKKYGIIKLYVFGSIAHEEATTKSDVDFLVEMQPKASLFGIAGFAYDAKKMLAVIVDVVPISLLPEIQDRKFANNIQHDAVVL